MTAAFLSLNMMFLFPFGQDMESFFLGVYFPIVSLWDTPSSQIGKTSWLYKSIIYLGRVHRASHFLDWTYQNSQHWERTNPRYKPTKRLEPSFSLLIWTSLKTMVFHDQISPIASHWFLFPPRWLSLSCWNLWRIHVALWPTYLWSNKQKRMDAEKDDDCFWSYDQK